MLPPRFAVLTQKASQFAVEIVRKAKSFLAYLSPLAFSQG
jgi:hypothetical protein